MKLVAIVGSFRKASLNRKVFENYKTLAGSRAEIIEGDISTFPVYNEEIELSAFPAVVTQLSQLIKSADGLIFFSPEYNASIPGGLKNAIDWLSRIKDQPFANKPVAVIGASPGRLGTARMQYHLRQVGVPLDMRFLNKPEIMIAEAHKLIDTNGKITDERTLKLLQTHFESFTEFISKK